MYIFDKSEISNFADDNTLSKESLRKDIVILNLENDSENAINWFSENQMFANPDKFQAILIKKGEEISGIPLKINNIIIESETNVILLGINIDNQLSFSKHIANLCLLAAKKLNAIN